MNDSPFFLDDAVVSSDQRANLRNTHDSIPTWALIPVRGMSNEELRSSRDNHTGQLGLELGCDKNTVPAPLLSLQIGEEYEYQDRRGNWFPITITGYDSVKRLYLADVNDGSGATLRKVKPDSCVKAANPSVFNWSYYIFQLCVDITIFSLVVVGLYLGYPILHTRIPPMVCYFAVPLLIPFFLIARCVLYLIFPQRRAVNCAPSFVCRKVELGGKSVYFVGTMHISPGSVRDVKRITTEVEPHVIMIELDYDRLEGMKEEKNPKPINQRLFTAFKDDDDVEVMGVHADWNAAVDKRDYMGKLQMCDDGFTSLQNRILVLPYKRMNVVNAMRNAQERGASAVFFSDLGKNGDAKQPSELLMSSGGLLKRTARCCVTRHSTPPNIPGFLVPAQYLAEDQQGKQIEGTVNAELVPLQSSLGRTICRGTIMLLSGISVLYGIIRLAGVEVGGEFLISDKIAREKNIPLVTIDMSITRLGRRLGQQLLPRPRNIWYIITAWLAFPRIFLSWLCLPMTHKVDLFLSMAWGFGRFRIRTWAAFLIAILISTSIIVGVFFSISEAAKVSVEKAGGNSPESKEYAELIALLIPLSIQAYLYPAVYQALLESRNEQMYRGLVAQIRNRPKATKFMVVIGAAHANGMIERCYDRGF